jgi:alpha-tubulin suppressor-like RCC1 family protein
VKPVALREDLPRFVELDEAYEIVRELGRGGTAVVYLARERELGREVAIKVIRSTYVEDEEAAARLEREARTVGGLQHPNIVMLFGTRRLRDGSLALVMQYVPGHTLKRELAERGPLAFDHAERVLRDLGGALAYAHRRRIVHRDLKPENVYIDEESGAARLSDFGIARPWGADSSLTLPGSAIGTPAYMSPEQIDGRELDGRSDLFALGLVGWELLTGRAPWAGENLYSIIYRQKHEELPPLEQHRAGVPPALRTALDGLLRKRPEERWQSAEQFLAALAGQRVRPGAAPAVPAAAGLSGAGSAAAPQPATDGVPAAAPASPPESVDENPTIRYQRVPEGGAELLRPVVPPEIHPWMTYGDPPATAAAAPAASATASSRGPASEAASGPGPQPEPRRRRTAMAAGAALLVAAVAAVAWLYPTLAGRDDGASAPPPGLLAPASPAEPAAAPVGIAGAAYLLAGDEQEAEAGSQLADPIVVRVEDEAGRPVANAVVEFRILAGGGELEPVVVATDEFGLAATRWRLAGAGLHTAIAAVEGVGGPPVTFHALAHGPGADDPTAPPGPATAVTPPTPETTPPAVQPAPPAAPPARPAPVLAVRGGVAAGGLHSCVLGANGAALCWGGNDRGQLGDVSSTRRALPVAVAAPEPLARLAAGLTHSCGIGSSGAGWCWGANAEGQLGDGTRADRQTPTRVAIDERLSAIAAGVSHTCALTASGAALCWGDNAQGQLGDGTRTARDVPVRVGGSQTFTSIEVGWAHTCALTGDGRAYCWGRNASGELGDGSTTTRPLPTAVTGGHRFGALAAGSGFTCGLRADGAVLCWGDDAWGQLGAGGTSGSAAPVRAAAAQPFTAVAAGGLHACALAADGTAHCWGRNNHGQLGDGTTQDRPQPTPVEGGRRFTSLGATGSHSCATDPAGTTWCWGYNLEGQLGNGTRTSASRPVAVGRQ